MDVSSVVEQTKNNLSKTLENFKNDLATVRTGRASPSIIENVKVEAYGTQMRLMDLSSISVGDARLLIVSPFDQNNISIVEKAIREAGLGLNPSTQGNIIRVPLPLLSEETRKNYLKLVHDKSEQGRISVRNIRHDVMEEIDKAEKTKDISEDEKFRLREQVQKEVEKVVSQLEELVKAKEQELMAV